MISLFLNTSSSWFNVAIVKDDKVLDEFYQKYDRDLSKDALYMITVLLSNNNLSVSDIDEVVCVRGPGSFTGLRIGVTIAKTICYFLNKKLYSTSSLEVMASSVSGDLIVPIIDARRGYVYGAIYDNDYNLVMDECYIKCDDLIAKVNEFSGKAIFVSLDEFDFDVTLYKPDLDNFYKCNFKKEEDSMTFIPNYLKKTEAEENLNGKGN